MQIPKTLLLALTLSTLGSPSCSRHPTLLSSELIVRSYRDADVILFYGGPDSLHLTRPGKDDTTFSLSDLSAKLEPIGDRRLIIVTLSKSVHSKSREEVRRTTRELKSRLHALGFDRIVIKLATGRSVSFYYEL